MYSGGQRTQQAQEKSRPWLRYQVLASWPHHDVETYIHCQSCPGRDRTTPHTPGPAPYNASLTPCVLFYKRTKCNNGVSMSLPVVCCAASRREHDRVDFDWGGWKRAHQVFRVGAPRCILTASGPRAMPLRKAEVSFCPGRNPILNCEQYQTLNPT